jgi:3-hydroxyacyl-CoA dehydrogenase
MSTTAPVATPPSRIAAQPTLIRRAAVLGAGTMGSRIAAHLANAGIATLLLDMVPAGETVKNKLALSALDALAKAKPAAFYDSSLAALITAGNFDEDLPKLAQCDWIIEAVAENLAIKTSLLARVVPHLSPRAVLTTNTSGLPVKQIAAGLSSHRDRFFGTHFFNPPRYMRLLEIIPTAETDPTVVAAFSAFADRTLGKQVVRANDTPNFIANRVGVSVMFNAASLMLDQGLTIEEVDALTGQALGWPRTGTFRLADMVGIDILAHVAANFPQGVTQGGFSAVLDEIMKRGWLGDKAGQGFYKKSRGADGKGTPPGARRRYLRIPTRSQGRAACSRNGQKRRHAARALAHAARQRSQKRQGRRFSLAFPFLAVELRRRPHWGSGQRCALY